MRMGAARISGLFFLILGVLAEGRPNVLFIISDDLTAEALGCYGNGQVATPNIDGLAERGMRFTRVYCQYPVCGPSRAALMSGLYPQQNGVVGNGSSGKLVSVLGERPTLPQHFKENGYRSSRVSKIYHMRVPGDITAGVDGPDHPASWSERFNCQAPEWMTEGKAEHLSRERLKFDPDGHYGLGFGSAFYVVKGEGSGVEQADTQAATKAIEILQSKGEAPFFLAVGLVRPHVPLVAPEVFFEGYDEDGIELMERVEGDRDDIPRGGVSKTTEGTGLAGEPAKERRVLAAYYAAVSYMDAQVGRILAALDECGLREKTIVVFTSDHGYHLGEHDFWQKMSLHEESVRVPLIVDVPGRGAGVSESLVEAVDYYPTLVELAGLAVPEHCVGKSFAGILDDPAKEIRDEIYCMKGKAHLLRTAAFAYMSYPEDEEELYDMVGDPKQYVNLAGKPAAAGVLEEMRGRLERKLDGLK